MGILDQLLRAMRLSDDSWCCESCERAARSGRHGAFVHATETAHPGQAAGSGSRQASGTKKP